MTLNIFFIGDIVGTPGLDLAATLIPVYVKKYSVDLLIVNGENTTEGKGIAAALEAAGAAADWTSSWRRNASAPAARRSAST